MLEPIGTKDVYDPKSGDGPARLRKNIGVLRDYEAADLTTLDIDTSGDFFVNSVGFAASACELNDEDDDSVNEALRNFHLAARAAFYEVDRIVYGCFRVCHDNFLERVREDGLL